MLYSTNMTFEYPLINLLYLQSLVLFINYYGVLKIPDILIHIIESRHDKTCLRGGGGGV